MTQQQQQQQQHSKLINQGGYGCIYYPSLPFKISTPHPSSDHQTHKNQQSSKKYISKLQKHNFHSEFEDFIGKVIQDIPCYELFFVPVLKTYQIDLATIKQEYLNDCDAVSKYIKQKAHTATKDYTPLNKMFIIQKMNYIHGLDLKKYVYKLIESEVHTDSASTDVSASASDTEESDDDDDDAASVSESESESESLDDEYISRSLRKDERQIRKINEYFKIDEHKLSYHLLSILFDLYERITDSIQLLIKYDIIHYDLKNNNILIENTTQLPMLIDFGLSIYVKRLLENPWKEKNETSQTIDSDIMFKSQSSKLLQNNYYWKQHFYVHAPEYYLWPLEVHIITFLINEQPDHDRDHDRDHDFTEEDLALIIYQYIVNNRALQNTSHEFKMKYMELCQETFKPYTANKTREYIINTLFTKYWNTWDTYANNIMFLKLFYGLIMNTKKTPHPATATPAATGPVTSHKRAHAHAHAHAHARPRSRSPTEQRQEIHDPDPHYLVKNKDKIRFDERFQIKLKDKYATNHKKLIDVIQIMLRNIHPNPEKRLTPQETKTFFSSVFYDC